jgi:hypothetical protein
MNKSILILFFLISPLITHSQETITITTYYPAPYGVYRHVRLFPTTTVPACDSNNEGVMYYDSDEDALKVCTSDGSGYSFSYASLWIRSGSNIYPYSTNWNVGIGTTTPGARLRVSGGNAIFDGDVGIGTTAPVSALHIQRGSGVSLLIESPTSSWAQLNFRDSGLDRVIIRREPNSNDLTFYTGGNERLRIQDNGDTRIGTSSLPVTLEVNDRIRITGGSPSPGKVLTAIDDDGLAEWRDPSGGTGQWYWDRCGTCNSCTYYEVCCTATAQCPAGQHGIMGGGWTRRWIVSCPDNTCPSNPLPSWRNVGNLVAIYGTTTTSYSVTICCPATSGTDRYKQKEAYAIAAIFCVPD